MRQQIKDFINTLERNITNHELVIKPLEDKQKPFGNVTGFKVIENGPKIWDWTIQIYLAIGSGIVEYKELLDITMIDLVELIEDGIMRGGTTWE